MWKTSTLIGHLDGCFHRQLTGWAADRSGRAAMAVDIYLDGSKLATVPCREFRPDVQKAGHGDGCHGFQYPLPARVNLDNRDHVVTVCFGNTRKELMNGTLRFAPSGEAVLYSAVWQQALRDAYWEITELDETQGLGIAGHAIRPAHWFGGMTFTINGRPFPTVELVPATPERAAGLGVEEGRAFAFRCHAPREMMEGSTAFELAVTNPMLRPFDVHQTLHYYPIAQPMPDPQLRGRVSCRADQGFYASVGATIYGQLNKGLQWCLGKSLDDFGEVLDWGCGCARVLRYMAARQQFRLVGVDVDGEAVAWCRQAFPQVSFHHIGVQPPMPLPAEQFDLIYGISVLTHLGEQDQFRWLTELRRVSRPGAVVLLTTHNEPAWFRNSQQLAAYLEYQKRGFDAQQPNPTFDRIISEPGYYRTTFHHPKYIEQQWGRFFKLVTILPGMIGGRQDLVVMIRE